ncbi:MAG: methyltransferase domain-containing protein [Mycobacteriales bacterium]
MTRHPRPKARSRAAGQRRPTRPAQPAVAVELVCLPGLRDIVSTEVTRSLAGASNVAAIPGREDTVRLDLAGSFAPLLALRTVVAPYRVLSFDVPRPKSLIDGPKLRAIAAVIDIVSRLNKPPPASFRFDAAGSDSSVFQRLGSALADEAGLPYRPDDGECQVRVRRSLDGPGWDVLVRLSSGPLSARPWRVADHPAGANATVAAAMALLTHPKRADLVLNLMCGTGTLLIERLLTAPAAAGFGIDVDASFVDGARQNLAAAGLSGRAACSLGDVTDPGATGAEPWDVVLADPPWGDKSGRRSDLVALHASVLERAIQATLPGGRICILTAEMPVMQEFLRGEHRLSLVSATSVFHKGHWPQIYLLRRQG